MSRNEIEDRLLRAIRQAMRRNPSIIDDAIIEGRMGLRQMDDDTLREIALDYGIVDADCLMAFH